LRGEKMSLKNDAFEKGLLLFVAVMGMALLVLAFLSLPFGAYAFFSNQMNGTSPAATFKQLYVFAMGVLIPFSVPSGILSLGSSFFFIWAVYVALFVLLVKGPWYNLIKALRSIGSDGTLAVYSNGSLTWSFAFPFTLLLAVFMDSLLTSAGVPVGSLSMVDARYTFWIITYAPLVEEVGFRVMIIGLVTLLIALRLGGRWKSLWVLWHPSRTLGALRIEAWKQQGIYAAIMLSAVVFGVQHVLGGWQIGKFFDSFIIGLAFGILYFTHGLPVAVMMHWGFDYFEFSLFYFDQVRGLPPLTSEFTSFASLQYGQFYADLLVFLITFAILALAAYMIGKALMARRPARPATITTAPTPA
jgi:hypothetical protein